MKVSCSLDPLELERTIVRRVAERPHGGLLDPLLILVPTRRLAIHLKALLAREVGAALGVHVFTHRGLAARCLECALEVPPAVLPRALLEKLVEALAAGEPGEEAEGVRRFGGARAALASSFEELREALVKPEDLRGEDLARRVASPILARLYERYARALDALGSEGATDRAGAIEAALPRVEGFLRRKGIRRAIHHGAYELTGVHLELLDRIARTAETEVLVPVEPGLPASRYAQPFLEALRARGASFEVLTPAGGSRRREWVEAVRGLYGGPGRAAEARRPDGIELEVHDVQGPEAELELAALRALALYDREGVPLEEIAIVARSLEPYVPFIEPTFEKLRLPFSTSASVPLARDPEVSAFLALVEVLARDFPRGRVIDLLARPSIRFPLGTEDGRLADLRDADRWDRWSREARIVGGLESWRELGRWADRPPDIDDIEEASDDEEVRRSREAAKRSVGELLAALGALEGERKAWEGARTFAEHAAFLRGLARRCLAPSAAGEGVAGLAPEVDRVLRAVERADAALRAARAAAGGRPGERLEASIDEVARLVRSVAESEEIPLRGSGSAGIRVLDVMQARCVPHRVVIWIGFHEGSFPWARREDPYLGDDLREELARAGRPLLGRARGAEEERLLLAVTLAGATGRLVVSFQRADEDGRRIARSSALREVARAFAGRPDARWVLEATGEGTPRRARISAHPAERGREIAVSEAFGLIPPGEALAARAAAIAGGPEAAKDLSVRLFPEDSNRLAALDCVAALESFGPALTAFDGRVAEGLAPKARLSPTALERLSRCPLAFFLRHVLGLRELEDEAVPHRVEVRVLGIAVHKALAEVYRELGEAGLLGAPGAAERAVELLAGAWRRRLGQAIGEAGGRLRTLFDVLGDRWLAELEAFVRRDLEELRGLGARSVETEKRFEARVPLGGRAALRVAGRADRVVALEGGWLVDDYKTHGNLEKRASPAQVARGLQIQLPVYREALAAALGEDPARIRARYLGVGPEVSKEEAELGADPRLREGALDTLREILRLARGGFYPLFPSDDRSSRYCSFCGYRKTCRKSHEPTLHRLSLQDGFRTLERVRRKDPRNGRYLVSEVPEEDGDELDGGDEPDGETAGS